MAKLIVKFKDATLREVPITKSTITIGRMDENDIKIKNLAVSREHAKVVQNGDHYILEDLKSMNGTYVNDKKVMKCILKDNDEIMVGKHILVFSDEVEKPIEMIQNINIPLTERTVILDTKKQKELISKPECENQTIMEKSSELKGHLSIISGGVGQKDVELTKRLTIGGKGKDADIKLRGFFVGKTAFIIMRKPDEFSITHSGGRRLTKVNGKEVEGERELRDGDIIEIGSTKMRFCIRE